MRESRAPECVGAVVSGAGEPRGSCSCSVVSRLAADTDELLNQTDALGVA